MLNVPRHMSSFDATFVRRFAGTRKAPARKLAGASRRLLAAAECRLSPMNPMRTHIRRKSAEQRHSVRSAGADLQHRAEIPVGNCPFCDPGPAGNRIALHVASVKSEVSQVNAMTHVRPGTSLPSRQRVAVATYRLVRDQVWTMMALVRLLRVQRQSSTGVLEEEKW